MAAALGAHDGEMEEGLFVPPVMGAAEGLLVAAALGAHVGEVDGAAVIPQAAVEGKHCE